MKKKILVLFGIMLLIVISCGKGKDSQGKNPAENGGKVSKKSQVNETEKYNAYINIYNNALHVDDSLYDYFEDIDKNEKYENPGTNFKAASQEFVDRIKETIAKAPKFDEIDKAAEEYAAVLEEFIPIGQEADNYYDGKDFLNDNFAKAKEIKGKIKSFSEKYFPIADKFKAAVKKKQIEVQAKELAEMERSGRVIAASRMKIMGVAEEILAEISTQGLNIANFTTKGDVAKFKELQSKYNEALEKYQKAVNDAEQLKKEGYDKSATLSLFTSEAVNFKAKVATFVNRIETKKASSESTINMGSFFHENDEGTPENVFKGFNDLVNDYNSSNR